MTQLMHNAALLHATVQPICPAFSCLCSTIYSSSNLELSQGPVVFTLPPSHDIHYFSALFVDVFGNIEAKIISTQQVGHGRLGGRYEVQGAWQSSDGAHVAC